MIESPPLHDRIGHCGWCDEVVGYRLGENPPLVSRLSHMRKRHPIRRGLGQLLASLFHGDVISFPITWSRVGHE